MSYFLYGITYKLKLHSELHKVHFRVNVLFSHTNFNIELFFSVLGLGSVATTEP